MEKLLVQVLDATEDKLMVFELNPDCKGFSVGHDVIRESSGSWKCACAVHRFKKTCRHMDFLPDDPFSWTGIVHGSDPANDYDIDEPIDPMDEDVGVVFVNSNLPVERKPLLIQPVRNDVHLWQVLESFDDKSTKDVVFADLGTEPDQLDGTNGTLSRLFREVKSAYVQNLPFTAESVMSRIDADGFVLRPVEEEPVSSPVTKTASAGTKTTGVPWRDIKPPKGFWVLSEVWEACLYAASRGVHVLAKGPTGCGKTELFYHVAERLGVDLEPINFGAMTEARTALIGAMHFDKETGTWFKPSRYITALQKPAGIILCDEITRAPPDAFNLVLPAMDRQGYVAVDEDEEAKLVYKGANVSFFATANIGLEYTGTMALDRALEDRFAIVLDLTYPPADEEMKVLKHRVPSARKATMNKLAKIAATQRGIAKEGDFTRQISTRMLIDCCEMISNGVSAQVAITMAILNKFDTEGDEESERVKVAQIFQKERLLKKEVVPDDEIERAVD